MITLFCVVMSLTLRKNFRGSSSDILTPNGECTRDYIDGPAALKNNTQQVVPPTGVTAYNCRIPRDNVYSYNHGEVKLKLSEEEVHRFKVSQPYKAVGWYTDEAEFLLVWGVKSYLI